MLYEREEIIECIPAALVAGNIHCLLIGPPGVGKSLLARAICNSIDEGSYFEALVSKHSVPEQLWGPVSLKALKADRFERCLDGTLATATVAFIDEIFKSSSSLLHGLLSLLNEGVFKNGTQLVRCPLQMMVAASNEWPQGEELGAFFDRLLLKFTVQPLQEANSFAAMLQTAGDTIPDVLPKTTPTELAEKREASRRIRFAPELLVDLRRDLRDEGITPSDRTFVRSVRLVQAVALLRGGDEVIPDDLGILAHVLFTDPAQARTTRRVVGRIANPLGLKILELADMAAELHEKALAEGGAENAAEASHKLRALTGELKDIARQQSPQQQVETEKVMRRVQTLHREILSKQLGLVELAP